MNKKLQLAPKGIGRCKGVWRSSVVAGTYKIRGGDVICPKKSTEESAVETSMVVGSRFRVQGQEAMRRPMPISGCLGVSRSGVHRSFISLCPLFLRARFRGLALLAYRGRLVAIRESMGM